MAVHPFQSEGQPVSIFQPIVAKFCPLLSKSSNERKREIASESLQPMSWPGSPSPIMRTALTQQVTTTDRGKSSPNTRQRLDTTSWLVAAKGRTAQVTIVQANEIYCAQFWTQENNTTYKNLTESDTKRASE